MDKITAQDAAAVVQIVDVMTQRGAIRGDELSAIALIRQKFLTAAQEGGAIKMPEVDKKEEK